MRLQQKAARTNFQERTIIVDHSFDHRAVKVESMNNKNNIIIMGLYHVCFLFCVSYVCNFGSFHHDWAGFGGREEQKQNKGRGVRKKIVKRKCDNKKVLMLCVHSCVYKQGGL